MNWITSIVKYNRHINLERIGSIAIISEDHIENCSIMFDDYVWRGYKNFEDFKKDLNLVNSRCQFGIDFDMQALLNGSFKVK